MKLQCHRSSLAASLQIVSGVVPARTPKEILRNVKLQVSDGSVTLLATDQEVGIRVELAGVETDSSGEVLLPTTRVSSILRELTDETVNIEVTESSICIQSASSRFSLASEDPDEFPDVASFEGDQYFAIPGAALREGINRTVFSTDQESTRYALGGVLLDPGADRITLAATDSRRLAVAAVPCRSEGIEEPANPAPVVPAKAMRLIERSISDEDEEVQVAINANDILVRCGQSTIYSRLVEGRFPSYAELITTDNSSIVTVEVDSFHSAVRQAQIVTSEESRGVYFTFGKGQLTLETVAADVGESKIEIPVSFDGEEVAISFDPRFIIDFLKVLKPESTVSLHLVDGESAAVFCTDDGYTYVVMPLSKDR
ncbi:MAG: DNA polymerase III subunit beta [Planctomycetaceae bacterium]